MDPENAGARRQRPLRHLVHRVEDAVLALLLTAMIVLAALQIFLRNLFDAGIGWADPAVRLLVLWVGLLGALAASRDDRQINVDVLSRLLPPLANEAVRTLTHAATAAIAAVVSYQAWRFVLSEYEYGSVAFAAVPTWASAAVVPVAFGGIALRYLGLALRRVRLLRAGGRELS